MMISIASQIGKRRYELTCAGKRTEMVMVMVMVVAMAMTKVVIVVADGNAFTCVRILWT